MLCNLISPTDWVVCRQRKRHNFPESQFMTQASVHSWCNGQIKQREEGAPSVASVSFHLGTGVFDGLMAYWNGDHYYLHCVEEHLSRFKTGATRMGLHFDWTVRDLVTAVEELLAQEPKTTQYIRPISYRSAPE